MSGTGEREGIPTRRIQPMLPVPTIERMNDFISANKPYWEIWRVVDTALNEFLDRQAAAGAEGGDES